MLYHVPFTPSGGGEGGGYFLVVGAVGLGCIFTNGLTIMGLHFYKSYQNGVAHFQKIQVCSSSPLRDVSSRPSAAMSEEKRLLFAG